MKRISTDMPNFDMQYHLRIREWKMNEMQNKMASQSRIQNLRDDPLAASHSTRLQSVLFRMRRYTKNIETVRGSLAVTEGYLSEAVTVLQRIREIAIQGANGILQTDDMKLLGDEVNQLLNELVSIGNARTVNGNTIFSGFRNGYEPFRATRGIVSREREEVIVSVDYMGDIGRNRVEISANRYVETNIPGNRAFWAENQTIYSVIDARNYQVQQNAMMRMDGVDVHLKEGDNVYAIIDKINSSGAAVRARLDPVQSSLVLETTIPHQIWPEDVGDAHVLQDLGILSIGDRTPPLNIDSSAHEFGGSVFDMVIHLRDALYEGDFKEIGGAGIRGIDDALGQVVTVQSGLGAEDARLEETYSRLSHEIPVFLNLNSQEVDLDVTEAITNLKMLEFTHEAALATAARVMQLTLLNYLR